MKITFTVLLLGTLLCGCSKKHAASETPAADLIVAGKDSAWRNGYVLHIEKRDGDSVEGIHLTSSPGDPIATVTAEKGTIRRVSKVKENGVVKSVNSVEIFLDQAHYHYRTSQTDEVVNGAMIELSP